MTLHSSKRRLAAAVGALGISALVLAGCSSSTTDPNNDDDNTNSSANGGDNGDTASGGGDITIGTTDVIVRLDPAGAYDNGSFAVANQIYPFLMNSAPGTAEVTPDIAESAEFISPHEYQVKLKSGLKFANGNELTASDVVNSFQRQITIDDPLGPSSLLADMEKVEATDDLTVVFTLTSENSNLWPQILSSPAGLIVDEDVFPADALVEDDAIVEAKPFAGQYVITNYTFNELVRYEPNADYQGNLGEVKNDSVTVTYYAEASNLRLATGKEVDVAYRSLSATDVESMQKDDSLKVVEGPGGELRYIVFNFNTMPFGATSDSPDADKAKAVRQAMASLIDRQAVADDIYKGTFQPVYSFIPEGIPGATEPLKELYGDGQGGPSIEKAQQILDDAGVETPVDIKLQYNGDHYGPSSGDEYAAYKTQLEEGGLFTVDLQQTEWVQYSDDRVNDVYPVYQLGWFPDYSDADNYISVFFSKDNFLENHYDNAEVQQLIKDQVGEQDQDVRMDQLAQIQDIVGEELSTLPILQGKQVAVTTADIEGTTLDASFKFRYATLSK